MANRVLRKLAINHNPLWNSAQISMELLQQMACDYWQNTLKVLELNTFHLTRSIQDSETSIDFVQGPPGSRRERVKK